MTEVIDPLDTSELDRRLDTAAAHQPGLAVVDADGRLRGLVPPHRLLVLSILIYFIAVTALLP